jgi:hypothetical protein
MTLFTTPFLKSHARMQVSRYVLDFAFLLENKVSKPMLKRNEIICKSYVILTSNTAMYPAAES